MFELVLVSIKAYKSGHRVFNGSVTLTFPLLQPYFAVFATIKWLVTELVM